MCPCVHTNICVFAEGWWWDFFNKNVYAPACCELVIGDG